MTEITESSELIELVIDKHKRFLGTFNSELSELGGRLDSIRQRSDEIKKELNTVESKISVLTEKYHLLYHQAKKQREDIFIQVHDTLRTRKAQNLHDLIRIDSRIGEFEKKLQTSKNIEDEEKIISEIKKLLDDFESAARGAGIIITCEVITEKLNEANSSHKELLSLQDKPKEHAVSAVEYDKQISEIEGRHNWLKNRIESHNNALAYWENQKGVMKIE